MTFLCLFSAACLLWGLGAALVVAICGDRYHPIVRLRFFFAAPEAAMSAPREPVVGRYHGECGPGFVTIDVEPLVDNNTHDVLDLLSSDEFFEEFVTLASAAPTGEHDGFAPDRLAFEDLKNRLVERLSTRAAMTGPQAVRVGHRVKELGEQMICEAGLISTAKAAGLPVQKHRRTA